MEIVNKINRVIFVYTIIFIFSISAIFSQESNLIKIYNHTFLVDSLYKQAFDTTDSKDYLYSIKKPTIVENLLIPKLDYLYNIKKATIIENLLTPKLEISFQSGINFQGGFLIFNCKFFDEGVYITRYDCEMSYGIDENKVYTSRGYIRFNNFYAKPDTKFSNDSIALAFLKELNQNDFFNKSNQKVDEKQMANLVKNIRHIKDIWPVYESYDIQYGKLRKRFQLLNPAQKTDNIEWTKNQNISNLFEKLYLNSK